MRHIRSRGEAVRRFILDQISHHPRDIARITCDHFRMSRQATVAHLNHLIAENAIVCTGVTSDRRYALAPLVQWNKTYALGTDDELSEDVAWQDLAPNLGQLPDNMRRIWQYGFTEMFNNVLDHSDGSVAHVFLRKTAQSTDVLIVDEGVGIFRKIKRAMGLLDERHAVLELAKGKFTTDPSRHSGEGIFFTSRSFDAFQILSGGVYYEHQYDRPEDWIAESDANEGTLVRMRLHNHTARSLRTIFDQFSGGEEQVGFTKTVVPVKLAQYGDDSLVSRSQAKRLLTRVDKFKTVMLDFEGVEAIGQAFADEIFRVFHRQHPEIEFPVINANDDVKFMIARAKNTE